MTPEDKKIWDEVAKTVKPLKKKKKELPASSSFSKQEEKSRSVSLPVEESSSESLKSKPGLRTSFRPKITLGQDRLVTRKLRQGTYSIQATLDLHGYTQEEAYRLLQKFVAGAVHRQLKLILIITGKGGRKGLFSEGKQEVALGVLRQKVPQWLEDTVQFPGVLSVSLARPQDGGEGAVYVELRSAFCENPKKEKAP